MINSLDNFTKAYLTCALWSSQDENDNDSSYLDNNFSIKDISPNDLVKIKLQCEKFQKDNFTLLESAYKKEGYDSSMAGHDLWLTRNGHGAGFWDRYLNDIGDQLTIKAKDLKESDLYKGDDGKLYFSNLPEDKRNLRLR